MQEDDSPVAGLLRSVRTAVATSSRVAMPVDRMIGLPLLATWRRKGVLVTSAEPILNSGTPSESRKSALRSSSGVDRKRMPTSSA